MGRAALRPAPRRWRARLNHLALDGCLTWPKSAHEVRTEKAAAGLDYSDEERRYFRGCGLDESRLRLEALTAPRTIRADLDGDGREDVLAQVTTRDGNRRDLALCGSKSGFQLMGAIGGGPDLAHAAAALERWRALPAEFAPPGAEGGDTTWPAADGAVLVLERIEKSMHLLFFEEGRLQTRQVFRFVEPS